MANSRRPSAVLRLGAYFHSPRLLILVACLALQNQQSLWAQAQIDPSLPPAPLAHTRTLYLFPGFETVGNPSKAVPPLTTKQKYAIFWGKTFDPSLVIVSAALAGMSQAAQWSPNYGQGWEAYGERAGYYAGSIAVTNLFTDGILPCVLHQDPRYFRKGYGSVGSRMLYALKRVAVSRSDSGQPQFNTSGLLGFGISTAISNAWAPRSEITFGNNMEKMGIKVGVSALLNIVREFGIESVIGIHKHEFAD